MNSRHESQSKEIGSEEFGSQDCSLSLTHPGFGSVERLVKKRDGTVVWATWSSVLRHTGLMRTTTTLWRPVGQPELDLIAAAEWSAFPPRLDWQPIFYPVMNEAYATRIAREWNTKDDENGNVGYVLRFEVETEFVARYPVQIAGDAECQELWVPAGELDDFNEQIVGLIEVVSEWRNTD